jgi:hypothetical protein
VIGPTTTMFSQKTSSAPYNGKAMRATEDCQAWVLGLECLAIHGQMCIVVVPSRA